MPIKVLVVDDSTFFRRRLSEILSRDPRIQVVGVATNGREAIEQTLLLRPDVVTMDYEMPLMDGISAVRHIMHRCPTAILMFSAMTHEGARITLDALEAGALDYMSKQLDEVSNNPAQVQRVLCEKVVQLARSRRPQAGVNVAAKPLAYARPAISARTERSPQLIVIGTSTGGPVALQQILTALPANLPVPMVVAQHMPAAFTGAFAERLNRLSQIQVKEACDGELLRPGTALIAPGGQQTLVDARGVVRVLAGDERLNFRPSVDVTFGSAARAYSGRVLGIVLTGMGTDGREGARLLKQGGSQVWTQDEASCVIYGMPMAVDRAGLSDASVPLAQVAQRIVDFF